MTDNRPIKIGSIQEVYISFYHFRLLIASVLSAVFVIFIFFYLSSPTLYRSEIVLEPITYESSGAISASSITNKVIGSAGLDNLLGGALDTKDPILIGIEEFKSKEFQHNFLASYDLLIDFFAIKRVINGSPVYDENVYSISKQKWTRPKDINGISEPNKNEISRRFEKFLNIDPDPDSGLIVVTFDFFSPSLAQEILSNLISSFNEYKRRNVVQEASQSINYINMQLEDLTQVELRSIFYRMIESEYKKIVFSNSRKDYFFKVIDPASLPDRKSSISLIMTMILASILGFILSTIIIFIYAMNPNLRFVRKFSIFIRS